ncbi:DMT family transporter [Gordonia sp. (in: high G+C Gram-positive bacteria)]|uniref:EamA family transporter n=1 Tax=Gordonia sp. (in: high G+C Gram-positive bacteria) TaxID=84139 RepID=UPI0016A30130|nr:DMT family transporter [Gordonia sp. (in: high G+C Gram-positive bacteria)]NLG48130.1 EamA family transporter [Gordonia sp. (in: high G+C Gram-positive bacteria)]
MQVNSGRRISTGLVFAVVSAVSFGMSGPFARALQDTGWSSGAAVTVRIAIGAAALAIPAAYAMRGRWSLLADRRNHLTLAAYGFVAVTVPQLCYFYAVSTLDVGVALLIEYTSPVAVVAWMWFRHGQAPTRLTFLGTLIAAAGLVLVLQLFGTVSLDAAGIAWAIGAMIGNAGYFVMSGHSGTALPAIAMAAGGLTYAALMLSVAGLVGVLPMTASSDDVLLAAHPFGWWVPVLALGFITAALAYFTGIAAVRRLAPRLASFVALTEVLAAIIAAWLLLDQVPERIQLVGGALVLAGVIVVKMGERPAVETEIPTVG